MKSFLFLFLVPLLVCAQDEGARSVLKVAPVETASAKAAEETWTDPSTKLTWAASDNGIGVTYSQAVYYCKTLTLGGHNDWTLASIDELHGLFGGPANENGHHILAPIKLTGWQWSSSPGKDRGEEWALDFGDGQKASVVMGDSGLNRALCVRRSGN